MTNPTTDKTFTAKELARFVRSYPEGCEDQKERFLEKLGAITPSPPEYVTITLQIRPNQGLLEQIRDGDSGGWPKYTDSLRNVEKALGPFGAESRIVSIDPAEKARERHSWPQVVRETRERLFNGPQTTTPVRSTHTEGLIT